MSRIKLNMYLDNQLVGVANNWQALTMRMDFEDDNVQPSLETSDLEFVLNESGIIRQWVSDGLIGGVGIFEPPGLRVEITDGTNQLTVFDGILDMVNDMKFVDCNIIRVKLKKKGGLNQLTERSQAISFAYLYSLSSGQPGKISDSDFVKVPYILAHIPNYREMIIIAISIFIMIKEIRETIKRTADLIGEIAGVTASGTTGGIGAVILAIAKILAQIIYIAFMIFAVIELANQLFASIFSPIRKYEGMKLRTLLEKGAEHLGYTFESTVFNDPNWDNLIILPIKEDRPDKITDKGFPTNKGQLYTYYDMLQFFKKLINGKSRVIGNILRIERKDFWSNQSTYVLPDVLLNEFSYNANEITGNLNIQFQIDEKDDTTLINYVANKSTFQRITEPKIVRDEKNVHIKDLEQVNLPVSLPTRKQTLTEVEELLLDAASAIDEVASIFSQNTQYAQMISARKGMLHLANDFTGTPKIIPMRSGKVDQNYRTIMNAEILHDSFYFINSFVAEPVNYSQFKKYEDIRIPFCFADYVTLSENSWFTTSDGSIGKFERIEGTPDGGFADVDFKIREIYSKNLQDKII